MNGFEAQKAAPTGGTPPLHTGNHARLVAMAERQSRGGRGRGEPSGKKKTSQSDRGATAAVRSADTGLPNGSASEGGVTGGEHGADEPNGTLVIENDADERPRRLLRDGVVLAEYRYNAFGERVKKVVHGTGPTPSITYFLYDGATLTAEIDVAGAGSGAAFTQYVHLDGHRPVARRHHPARTKSRNLQRMDDVLGHHVRPVVKTGICPHRKGPQPPVF